MSASTIQEIRQEFPILNRTINNQSLVYLDNAASTQKPQSVIGAIQQYYETTNANVHRGIHTLSNEATEQMELAREKVRRFINAKHLHEVIFTTGTTQSTNTVAYSLMQSLQPTDEILISELEHHSNIVPWQMAAERTGAQLKFIPLKSNGAWDLESGLALITENTRIVSVNQISNSLGVINPIKPLIAKAKAVGALVMLDAAQSVAHFPIDVQSLDVDFLAFSGHKIYGPTGTGVLYGKESVLREMAPFQGGGEMIKEVRTSGTTYADLPHKLEAGTPNIAGNIGLGAAIDFIQNIGWDVIHEQEQLLLNTAIEALGELSFLEHYAFDEPKIAVFSFNLKSKDVHPSDVGFILDKLGVAVRTGHHCTQPLMQHLGIDGTVRASFALYNTVEEIHRLTEALNKANQMLA